MGCLKNFQVAFFLTILIFHYALEVTPVCCSSYLNSTF